MMKTVFSLFLTLVGMSWTAAANATLIDNSTWGGSTNTGWAQSAQTLSFSTDGTLNSFGWWLGLSATHRVSVVEWSTSGPGTELFSQSQAWTNGFNEIFPNVALTAGSLYAVQFDYQGNISQTVHFNGTNGYNDGEWWLLSTESDAVWFPWSSGYDMRFVANFSDDRVSAVPSPATIALLSLGLSVLGWSRRKRA